MHTYTRAHCKNKLSTERTGIRNLRIHYKDINLLYREIKIPDMKLTHLSHEVLENIE